MAIFETVYHFAVLNEIKQGNTVFVIDKAQYGTVNAIQKANEFRVEDLMSIINHDTNDKRFEFYKITNLLEREDIQNVKIF